MNGTVNILEVDGLSVEYRQAQQTVRAVQDVSFAVAQSETLALVGESGCGKSTLARSLFGLLPARGRVVAGNIRFEGLEVPLSDEDSLRPVRGSRVGFVFQDPDTYLNPLFRIGSLLMDVIVLHKKVDRREARRLAFAQLAAVEFRKPEVVMDAYPHELSGGMRQRAMLAMATSCTPSLLIADEPTTALDVLVQRDIMRTLGRLKRDFGMSVLLVSHDLGLVARHADRVAVLYAGRIVETQPVRTIFRQPRHPYTAALVAAATPTRSHYFPTVAGTLPDLRIEHAGCSFQPRCLRRIGRCEHENPMLEWNPHRPGQFACWNPVEENAVRLDEPAPVGTFRSNIRDSRGG